VFTPDADTVTTPGQLRRLGATAADAEGQGLPLEFRQIGDRIVYFIDDVARCRSRAPITSSTD
jgi:hypothetical protein